MTQQLDLFAHAAPKPSTVAQGSAFCLESPSMRPTGSEAVERKAARLREIEDRRREKKGMVYA